MSKHIFSFEKLSVWQKTRKLSLLIYKITKDYPVDELFGLVSQLRRAIVSVSSNIAEGSSRLTSKDQAHFYNTSYSSLMEVLSQIILSYDLEFVTIEQYEILREKIEEISFQLNSLRNSALKRSNK